MSNRAGNEAGDEDGKVDATQAPVDEVLKSVVLQPIYDSGDPRADDRRFRYVAPALDDEEEETKQHFVLRGIQYNEMFEAEMQRRAKERREEQTFAPALPSATEGFDANTKTLSVVRNAAGAQ